MKRTLIIALMFLAQLGCSQILIGTKAPAPASVPPSPPDAPTLVSPENEGDSTGISVILSWVSIASATSYTVNVDDDSNFASLHLTATLAETTKTVTGLDSGTVYYWRVRGINEGGTGDWSTRWSFTTVPGSVPGAPILVSPVSGVDSTSVVPLLTWVPVGTVTSYDLTLSDDESFSTSVIETTLTGTSLQVTSALAFETTYYWRVRGTNSWGTGTYGSTSFITTPDVDAVRPAPIALSATDANTDSVSLAWVAVGDDSLTGTANGYDLRYSTRILDTGNVIANGAFASGTTGWTVLDGPGTIGFEETIYHTASGSLMLANGGSQYCGVYGQYTTSAAESVYVTMWVYSDEEKSFDAWVLNQNNAVIGGFENVNISADTWTEVSFRRALLGTQTAIRVGLNWLTGAEGDTLYLDDVDVRIGLAWESFTQATGEPVPSAPGTPETHIVSGLTAGTTYYFGIRAFDENGNYSALSNIVAQATDAEPEGPPVVVQDTSTSGDYHVAKTGSDSNPGTRELPWLTITHANPLLRGGDTLLVHAGTYDEVIQPDSSGDSYRGYITYMGYGTDVPVIRGTDANNYGTVGLGWNTANADQTGHGHKYIRLQNLNIQTVNEDEVSTRAIVYVTGTDTGSVQRAENIIIKRCKITASGTGRTRYLAGLHQSGIFIGYARSVSVLNCRIENMFNGIWTDHNKKPALFRFEYDTLISIQDMGFIIGGDGASAWGDTLWDSQILISHNYMDTSWTEDFIQFQEDYERAAHPWEEHVSGVHRGVLITDNVALHCAEQSGVDAKACDGITVQRNYFARSYGDNDGFEGADKLNAPFTISSPHQVFPQDAYSKHNINRDNILNDNNGGTTTRGGWQNYNLTTVYNRFDYRGSGQTDHPLWYAGMLTENDQENVLWGSSRKSLNINNIFVYNRVNFYASHTSDSIHINNNLYHDGTDGQASNVYKNGGIEYTTTTKAAWVAGLGTSNYTNTTGKDSASIFADPQFESTPLLATLAGGIYDFALSASSPAVGAAAPLMNTLNAGSNSTALVVSRPLALFAGFSGMSDILGDSIKVGNNDPVRVVAIDRGDGQMRHTTGAITVSSPITWSVWSEVWRWVDGRVVNDIGAKQR